MSIQGGWGLMKDKIDILNFFIFLMAAILLAILFYNSIFVAVLFIPFFIFMVHVCKKQRMHKQQKETRNQFASAIESVASAMVAGYSIENAFFESYKDMLTLYGERSIIAKDLRNILNKISINKNIEQIFREYAKDKNIAEISYFSDVLAITRKTGGNIIEVMKETKNLIYEKEDLERQIEIVTSSKRYECMIMAVMPPGIITYLRIFSSGYMNDMYGEVEGILVMTVFLIAYIVLIILSLNISRIKC